MDKIKVIATRDVSVYGSDRTTLQSEVRAFETFDAELYDATDEFFARDHAGREVHVGEIDKFGGLHLEEPFELLMR